MLPVSLKLVLRSMWKNRLFSALNIFGLMLGLASTTWLVLFLKNELTFDQYHPNREHVYRVSHLYEAPGARFNTAYSPSELSPMLTDEYPEIRSYARFLGVRSPEIVFNNQVYQQEFAYYTDPGAFDIFGINLQTGNPENALSSPGSVIISKSVSDRIFGNQSGINQLIEIDGRDLTVTGIFEDLPKNTHFKFEVLVSGVRERGFSLGEGTFNSEILWNPDCINYILLNEATSAERFIENFASFNEKYFDPFGKTVDGEHKIRLQKLASIHYDAMQMDDDFPKGNPTNLIVFSSIGLAILLLACINYINLATARAGRRAKEIGMRKVLGSDRKKLQSALLFESIFQSFVAYGLSLLALWLLIEKTPFQQWLGVDFGFNLFQHWDLVLISILMVFITGLVAGLYPAFYLASIRPAQALKGTWSARGGQQRLRRILVLFQFIISIGVLMATLLMRDQLSFLQQKDLGFEKDQILLINLRDSVARANYQVLKNSLESNPMIEKVSSSNFIPGTSIGAMVFKVDDEGEMKNQEFKYINGGADYLETFGIELLKGNFFRGDEQRGNQYFVINETAARKLGWDEPVGKRLGFFHQENPGQVIGMVKDFNFFSLHNPIEPLIFVFNPNPGNQLIVRFKQQNEADVLQTVQAAWEQTIVDYPLDAQFLQNQIHEQYEADRTQNKLIGFMSAFCAIISLIGLTGLTAFNVDQRKKEIGVRKVLGALPTQLVRLLFSDIFRLMLIAGIVAAPLSYYGVGRWMQNFEYQTGINTLLLVMGIAVSVVVTFVLVSALVLNAIRRNPVETLRSE